MPPTRILILGFGVSGKAAAKLAARLGYEIVVADERDSAALRDAAKAILPSGSTLLAGWREGDGLPSCHLAVASPGLSGSSPLLQAASRSGAELVSELEFGFRHLKCPALAITGTNGKTTTTELTAYLLNAAGLRAEAAGNIGEGLSEAALASMDRHVDWMVVEVSSFQLELAESFAPKAAALLNIASDHINRHGGMEGYAKLKFKIFEHVQRESRLMIANANVADWWAKFMPPGLRPLSFSAGLDAAMKLNGSVIELDGLPVFDMASAKMKGLHNVENAMASLCLVRAVLGDAALKDRRILDALASFKTGDHRIETFAEWNSIKFIDDSKGTNPHAVVAALKSLEGSGKACLVLGGLDKDMDFEPLLEMASKIRCAFVIGQCREKIAKAIGGSIPCELCVSFEEAVAKACQSALPGDAAMLSPACASMDMFKDYKERGDKFKQLVNEWLADKRNSASR